MLKRFLDWLTTSQKTHSAIFDLRVLFCQIANEIAQGSMRSSGIKPYYYEVMDAQAGLKRVYVQVKDGPVLGINNGNDHLRDDKYDFDFKPLGWNGQNEIAYYSLQIRQP